jgi:hypothetical protein
MTTALREAFAEPTGTTRELQILYLRLLVGGVLIIDDYGYWAGAREAVDEYFKKYNTGPFLVYDDYTGRSGRQRSRNSLRSGRLLFRLPRCAKAWQRGQPMFHFCSSWKLIPWG